MENVVVVSDAFLAKLDAQVKNCPCCGSSAGIEVYEVRKGWEANIQCNGCLLSYSSITYDTPEKAAEETLNGWNRRVYL